MFLVKRYDGKVVDTRENLISAINRILLAYVYDCYPTTYVVERNGDVVATVCPTMWHDSCYIVYTQQERIDKLTRMRAQNGAAVIACVNDGDDQLFLI